MADIEITDEASLEAWLKTRPRRDAFVVRSRATIRNLRPSTFSLLGEGVEKNLSLLVYLRFLQVTGLILTNPDALLGQAHFSATKDFSTLKLTQLADIEVERIPDPEDDDQEIRELDEISPDRLAKFIGKQNQLHVASQKLNLVLSVRDCRSLETGQTVAPLWHDTPAPDWFITADRETRAIWAKDPPTWAFWEKWWDGVISGDMPFAPDLLREVALIEDDIWQAGPKAVAEAIARIEAAHRSQPMNEIAADQALDRVLAKLPPAKDTAIALVREAVIAHRADLLENFEALQGFIALEVKRLQELNYMSDEHRDVCVQQVKTLSVIGLTVERLSALVPKQAGVAPDAAKIESLGRVYINLFQEWPRSNAREVVDTTCRLSIVGIGSVVAAGLGLPVAAISAVLTGAYLAQPLVKVVVDGGRRKKK